MKMRMRRLWIRLLRTKVCGSEVWEKEWYGD